MAISPKLLADATCKTYRLFDKKKQWRYGVNGELALKLQKPMIK